MTSVFTYFTSIFSVDCLYQPTSHLHHDFEAQVIAAGQSVNVNFTFYPREAKKYRELVIFEVNGLSKRSVEFIGLGTEMKVIIVVVVVNYHKMHCNNCLSIFCAEVYNHLFLYAKLNLSLSPLSLSLSLSLCVCVCVCVCEREKEREKINHKLTGLSGDSFLTAVSIMLKVIYVRSVMFDHKLN